jgi:membrane-associated phospholipid phosphatase
MKRIETIILALFLTCSIQAQVWDATASNHLIAFNGITTSEDNTQGNSNNGAIEKANFLTKTNPADSLPGYRPRGKRSIKAPSPYRLRLQKEIPIGVVDGAMLIASPFFMNKKSVLDPDKIENKVWKWERNVVNNHSVGAGTASDILLYTSTMTPFILTIDKSIRSDPRTYIIYAETMGTALATTGFIKAIAHRSRPYVYNPSTTPDRIIAAGATQSFLSGHTAITAANLFFVATVYAQHHPQGKLRPYLWSGAVAIPAVVGVLRVASGNHFPTDVIAGYALGALIGYGIPTIHKIRTGNQNREKAGDIKKL